MRRFKSESLRGLPFAPHHRKPPHFQTFNWACLIGVVCVGGCRTVEISNTSDRPWDRPTKADVSQSWWPWFAEKYWDSPGGHFP